MDFVKIDRINVDVFWVYTRRIVFVVYLVLVSMNGVSALADDTGCSAGGAGGLPFRTDPLDDNERIVAVNIWSGNVIDAIQLVASDDNVTRSLEKHGGNGGILETYNLDPDEYITGLVLQTGSVVDSLIIKTNKGESKRFGGNGGPTQIPLSIPEDSEAVGLCGKSGSLVDALGIVYRRR